MSRSHLGAASLNITQSNSATFKTPSVRRTSAQNFKTPLKDALSTNNLFSLQLKKEQVNRTESLQFSKTRKVLAQSNKFPNPFHAVPPKDSKQESQNQETATLRKSRLRTSKVWEHPDELKLKGMWQQYEELWFGIHCESVTPLLEDFPLPTITKSLNDVSDKFEEKPNTPEKTPASVGNRKKGYRIQMLSNKLKKIDQDLIPCSHCKGKKRKGMYLGCRHYFCRECLRHQVQSQIDQMKVPMKCMLPNCGYELERAEIVKNVSNSENVMKYFDLNVADFVKRRPHLKTQCFTEGCKYVIDMTKVKFKNILKCPRCKVHYCIPCHKPLKRGHICEDLNNLESCNYSAKATEVQRDSF